MRHRRISLLLPLLLLACWLPAQDTLDFETAARSRAIGWQAEGMGGYLGKAIRLLLRNNQAHTVYVQVPAGQFFVGEDSGYQRLMVLEPVVARLIPGQSAQFELATACTQSSHMAPRAGLRFRPAEKAKGYLLELAHLIGEKGYVNSTAQSAVWSLTSGHDVSGVYGEDTAMVRSIAGVLSRAFGKPISAFQWKAPRPHRIIEINASMEVFLKKDHTDVSLLLFNAAGEPVRRYFHGRKVEAGFMQYTFGHYHTGEENETFELRLFSGGELLARKAVSPADTVVTLRRLETGAILPLKIDAPRRVDVGLFDREGRLFMVLERNRLLQPGYHRSRFIVGKTVLPGQDYEIRLVDGQGNIVASTALNPEAPAPAVHEPIRFEGTVTYEVPFALTRGRMELINANGDLLAVPFEQARLSPGKKTLSYAYTSLEGPGARLFLRLLDDTGREIWRKEL